MMILDDFPLTFLSQLLKARSYKQHLQVEWLAVHERLLVFTKGAQKTDPFQGISLCRKVGKSRKIGRSVEEIFVRCHTYLETSKCRRILELAMQNKEKG